MNSADPIVFVVDDDLSVREALRSLIASVGLRCETFVSADEFLLYSRPNAPACLILDVHLAGASGLDLSETLTRSGIDIPVTFITGQGTIPMSVRAMKGGAVEFLTKPFSEQELLDALDQSLQRDRAARAARAQQEALRARFDKLTRRERDVFTRVAAGRMNKEIAAELRIAEQTIKQHRRRVMDKLEARSLAELVRFAQQLG